MHPKGEGIFIFTVVLSIILWQYSMISPVRGFGARGDGVNKNGLMRRVAQPGLGM